jgi:trans-aconitate methyltransferase
MKRIPEPELMVEPEQVSAYANADFDEPHSNFIEMLKSHCEAEGEIHSVLDLGCGPGDVTFKFAAAFPEAVIDAVDGSAEMLDFAKNVLAEKSELNGRINYHHAMIKEFRSPSKYNLIFSNSLLHHLPDPMVLWNKIAELSSSETYVFIMDLLRPETIEEAAKLKALYVRDEPEVLQKDFYNSLLAAFEIDEIREQLSQAGLDKLEVKQISDRHIVVCRKIV